MSRSVTDDEIASLSPLPVRAFAVACAALTQGALIAPTCISWLSQIEVRRVPLSLTDGFIAAGFRRVRKRRWAWYPEGMVERYVAPHGRDDAYGDYVDPFASPLKVKLPDTYVRMQVHVAPGTYSFPDHVETIPSVRNPLVNV
jgi:hypothetical protein